MSSSKLKPAAGTDARGSPLLHSYEPAKSTPGSLKPTRPGRPLLQRVRCWRETTELLLVDVVIVCGMAIACAAVIRYMVSRW
jgi:hypothetical protein